MLPSHQVSNICRSYKQVPRELNQRADELAKGAALGEYDKKSDISSAIDWNEVCVQLSMSAAFDVNENLYFIYAPNFAEQGLQHKLRTTLLDGSNIGLLTPWSRTRR